MFELIKWIGQTALEFLMFADSLKVFIWALTFQIVFKSSIMENIILKL